MLTTSETPTATTVLYLVVADGRRQRFYLTHFTATEGLPRFKAGAAGRANAAQFLSRVEADAAAQRAQAGDGHKLTWRAIVH
jgi:hypothetical protein